MPAHAGNAEPMLKAFALALGQMTDPRVLRIWLKSMAAALAGFAGLGTLLWWGGDLALARAGFDDSQFAGAADLRALLAMVGAVLGAWLLWRIVALAALQFFADEVVVAVEARHYPEAAINARRLGWREELARGLGGAARALAYNLLALPVALVLLATGIGAPMVFFAVNAVLLGRELQDMVWLRHCPQPAAPVPLGGVQRFVLGGVVTALLAVPLANLLAPFLGAAAAAHLIHRRGTVQ